MPAGPLGTVAPLWRTNYPDSTYRQDPALWVVSSKGDVQPGPQSPQLYALPPSGHQVIECNL